MKFIRYCVNNDPPAFGWINEEMVGPLSGSPLGEFRRLNAELPFSRARLLAPAIPSKIIGVGRNYAEHARERGVDVPEIPLLFLKAPSALIGPGDPILVPPQSQQVEHEAELAVVIGKGGRWISAEDAPRHILGYTIANDVTARDLQKRDGQWSRAKSFDTFCPLGPWIDTDFDPSDAVITCRVNGELRQMASTREMVFTVPQLVAFISSVMRLEPGDVILTGTPAGIGRLQPGESVEVEIEGLGKLTNPVELDVTSS